MPSCTPCTSGSFEPVNLVSTGPCVSPFAECDTASIEALVSSLTTAVNGVVAGLVTETSARTTADNSLQTQATTATNLAGQKSRIWPPSNTPPSAPGAGDYWIDLLESGKFKRYSGTSWVDTGLLGSQLTALADSVAGKLTAASNLSDVQSPSTARSNLGLGALAQQNKNAVDITGGTVSSTAVKNLPAPTDAGDAVTKAYADSLQAGIVPKTAVRVATTANLAALSTLLTIDGVTVSAGDRVLVKDQTTNTQNGVYVAAVGAWSRATDANTAARLAQGSYFFVSEGTANGSTGWFVQSAPTTLGTDPVVFAQFSAATAYTAGAGLTLTGNQFSANLGTDVQAYSAVLAAIAALTTDAFGLQLLTKADGNAVRTYVGAAASAVILDKNNNLSDLADVPTARTNLGVLAKANNLSDLTDAAAAKNSLNFRVLNLRDYGAVGNGVANDQVAIADWLAAATSNCVLYAPAGRYRFASGNFTLPSGISNVTFCGDGWSTEFYNDSGSGGNNSFGVPRTTTKVTIRDVAFTGSSTVRANGIHWRILGSYVTMRGCWLSGCSDFAVLFTSDTGYWSTGNQFVGNTVYRPLGDGVHFAATTDGLCANNTFYQTGDDGIAVVADDTSYVPNRISVVGNIVYGAGQIGVSGAGIRVAEGTDILVANNFIYQTKEAGIKLARYLSTSNYNNRVKVIGNRISYANSLGGSGGIMAHFTFSCDLVNNSIDDNAGGNGISILDAQELSIQGNTFRNVPIGIYAEAVTSNVATSWEGVTIRGNLFKYVTQAGVAAIHLSPGAGITLLGWVIDSNVARTLVGGFMYYNQVNHLKIVNNTSFGGAILGGGSVSNVTTANNN